MRAVVASRFGGPEVLEPRERPAPEPGPGQVAIRVALTSVNMVDTHIRSGKVLGISAPKPPFVPGVDATGTVISVGPGVTRLEPGDRVTAFTEGGSYAEVAIAREVLAYPVPKTVDDALICSMVAMVAAWNVLHHAARIQPGDSVLVHAAAGPVGVLAIQLARLASARLVVGLVGSADKREAAMQAGADAVWTYAGISEAARHAGGGFDVILDANGGPGFAANLDVLAPFGRLVSFGEASGAPGVAATSPLIAGNRSVVGYSSGHYRAARPEALRPAAEAVIALAAEGRLTIPMAARFDLAEAAEAHRLMESRRSTGKILLVP